MSQKTEGYSQYHISETARVAKEAHDILMRSGGLETLFCYYTKRLKQLHVATEKPHEDSQLAFEEKVPSHLTLEQLKYWFAARTGSVPYL